MTIVVDAIDRLELFYPSRYNLSAANLVACDGYLYIIVFIEGNESAVNALGPPGGSSVSFITPSRSSFTRSPYCLAVLKIDLV